MILLSGEPHQLRALFSSALRWLVGLFDLLDNNGALGHQGGDRADSGQGRQQDSSNHAECQWDLDQGLSLLVLDGDAADVSLTNQPF